MVSAARYFHSRNFWKHLPVLIIGVLAGYLVAYNRPLIQQSISTTSIESIAGPLQHPVRAAIVALVRNSDLFGLRLAMRQLEDRFNRNHQYPYIFLNDVPFTEEFKQGVQALTKAEVKFGELDEQSWGIPSWIDQERYEEVKRVAQYPHGNKDSYRKMCRFQAGYLHRHPLLRDLEYYWRIEPDVEYFCDIDYDPFVFMKQNGIKYGWNIAMTEFMDTIKTLWNTTKEFIEKNPDLIADKNMLEWLVDGDNGYGGCHFWSNFEIVDLSFYRSQAYQQYFDYLDRAGGFFYERWGDAPVHSLAAAMFLDADQIHYFEDIGYFHPSVLSCPRGASKQGKCVCDDTRSFVQDGHCTVRYKQVRKKVLQPGEPYGVHDVHSGPVIMAEAYVGTGG
ncbi:alpha-1,2-mannosyltransferase ktr1 [Coemansia sp. RSA 1286]|nr:alpha-1,2-mannosyltransferase ktr1 [Coemansia sp. RSA 1286]